MDDPLRPRVATHPIDYVYMHLEKNHGIPKHVASNRLHQIKDDHRLPADFALLFHRTGNVYREDTREFNGRRQDTGRTVMIDELRPNRKHGHLYAIIRHASDCDESTPVDLRFFVTKVVSDGDRADREVERLNELNKSKGYYYFTQVTRFEETAPSVVGVDPIVGSSVTTTG